MPARLLPPAPRALPHLLPALRADLLAADYTVPRIEQLLGPVAARALQREDPAPARRALAGATDPCAVLYSLLTLGGHHSEAEVAAALPHLGVDGAAQLGLLEAARPGGAVRALVDLSPYSATDDLGEIRWWIASDLSELATGAPLHPEHVLGVGGASLTLARLTPRVGVDSVLDLGCGGGIQALHASRHARRVVATDVSARALAFAAFTAALNGIEIELREGSLLEPVAGEDFDLIVSNPPFVITPRTGAPRPGPRGEASAEASPAEAETFTYRDGGRDGDTLLAALLRDLPAHLRPGGTAVMLGNWEISPEEGWEAHPRIWTAPAREQGLHAWVIQRERTDPAEYAATWARDGGVTPRDAAWEPMITRWLEDFASRDVEGIGFGYLMLRRPERPAAGRLVAEEETGTGSGTLAEHLRASLDALEQLEAMDDASFLALRPSRAADVVERRHLTPGEWDPMLIELVQGGGLARAVPVSTSLAATVGACDGTLSLEQIIAAVCALTDADPAEVRAEEVPRLRELVRQGVLQL
ncbi:DUF7059 domain-containing protein [Brachybacterium hainanense]|uniref:Methyltransferase n=1 Tax=Brachybacterium hainanense TaxID=1541174 RepID=A0ABV6RF38_9MICO